MSVLLGAAAGSGCLIRGLTAKSLVMESIIPRQMERFPWAGHLGLKLLPQVLEKIRSAGSTLVFTNTRSQAELLNFVSTGGSSLKAYPEFRKIAVKNGRYQATDKKIAARHRMNIGTITADAAILAKFVNGRRLGSAEERFVAKLKRGDVFVFAGRMLEFVRIKDMTLWVRKSRSPKGAVPQPQWMGGRMPLSTELASAVRDQLDRAARGVFDSPEMNSLRPILELQASWSLIPKKKTLLIEKYVSRDGYHLFIFP